MPDDFADVRPSADGERLLTAAEAATVLGVSERTIRRRIQSRKLPAIDAGGQMRIPASALGVRAPDATDSTSAGQRRPLPVVSSTTEAALVALIERQSHEIADLTGRLAVAEERLRQIGARETAQDAAVTHSQPPGQAKRVDMGEDAEAPLASVLGRLLQWLRGT